MENPALYIVSRFSPVYKQQLLVLDRTECCVVN